MATVLDSLNCLINQIEDSPCCSAPCGGPCFSAPDFPFCQVAILDPPCCPAPTWPKYVKPLTLPGPPKPCRNPELEFRLRIANFYNNHNIDYHPTGREFAPCCIPPKRFHPCAQALDGKFPGRGGPWIYGTKCGDDSGCPTGFKPCYMDVKPPPCNCKLSPWSATVMPCPPKRKCCK